ncbi:MAG: hypothetical protein ACOCUS_04260, partial [Polyangiales bacterium]
PYYQRQTMTSSTSSAQSAVNSLTTHYGGDYPESHIPALWSMATRNTLAYASGPPSCPAGHLGYPCGAAFGIGLLLDRGGTDRYLAYHQAQGFAYARAVGALWDADGNDEYMLHPSDVLYPSAQDPDGSNGSLGQGAGFGRRADATPDRTFMSGGLGVLGDSAGDDRYTAAIFAQGTGFWYGTGLLIDRAGDDHYDGQWYVQGGAAHFAIAVLLDEGGADVHNADARLQNVTLGGGHDFSTAWLVDRGTGADEYHSPNLSIGAGNAAGAGFFADAGGDDVYESESDFSFGNASIADTSDDFRRMVGTVGVFMDANGTDTYTRPTADPVANDASWTQTVNDGEHGEDGAGIDASGGELGF